MEGIRTHSPQDPIIISAIAELETSGSDLAALGFCGSGRCASARNLAAVRGKIHHQPTPTRGVEAN